MNSRKKSYKKVSTSIPKRKINKIKSNSVKRNKLIKSNNRAKPSKKVKVIKEQFGPSIPQRNSKMPMYISSPPPLQPMRPHKSTRHHKRPVIINRNYYNDSNYGYGYNNSWWNPVYVPVEVPKKTIQESNNIIYILLGLIGASLIYLFSKK